MTLPYILQTFKIQMIILKSTTTKKKKFDVILTYICTIAVFKKNVNFLLSKILGFL